MKHCCRTRILAAILAIPCIPSVSPFDNADKPTKRVQACGISSEYSWVNWMESIETDFPLVFPKTDQDIHDIIQAATQGGCKVRPVGTGHSYSGIVANKQEQGSSSNVIIVNLADYEPPSDWHYVLDVDRLRVRMSAGATLVDLQRFLLEKGYRLPVHTAGPLFSLGGVYLNPSVHGNTIGEDRCTSLLMGVRAMIGDGTIIEVGEDNGIEGWRGSMGLLGIALAIELRVYKFNGISLNRHTVKFGKNWNRENFEEVLQKELEGKDYFTFGYNYWENECLFFTGYINGHPEDYDMEAALVFYDNVKEKVPDMAKTGGTKIPTIAVKLLDALPANIAAESSFLFVENSMDSSIKNPGDGYFLFPNGPGSPSLEVHASLRCVTDCISDGIFFGVLDASRTFFDQVADATFPTLRVGIRFFDVKENMMTLEHLQPGRHIAVYYFEPRSPGNTVQPLQQKLMELHQVWDDFSCGTIGAHHSKHYGIGPVGDLNGVYPYQNATFANRFYNATTRANFLNLMNQYDPQGIFAGGEALFLLGVSVNKFEPRKTSLKTTSLADTSCKTEGNAECISGCCCSFCGKSRLFQCTEGGLVSTGSQCAADCECSSGHCSKLILRCT